MSSSIYPLYRIEVFWRVYPGTFRNKAGDVVTDVTVQAALLPARTEPAADTDWTTVTYTVYDAPDADGYYGETSVLIAGPDADISLLGASVFQVPEGGGDLCLATPDVPELDLTLIERFEIL